MNRDQIDFNNSTNDVHRMGTSIMAVTFNGGVIMGADSRTTTGSYIANRVSDKLTSISDYIYCCRSGSAADTQAISEIVRYYLDMHTYGIFYFFWNLNLFKRCL